MRLFPCPTRSDQFPVRVARPALALLAAGAMAGCATLPRNGPTGGQIVKDETRFNAIGFRVVDITPANIATLATVNVPGGTLAALAADGRVDILGPGDVLSVEIYEVGVSLFGGRTNLAGAGMAGEAAPSASGQSIGDSGVVVDRDGNITIPYAGTISVAGLTPGQVQVRIVAALRGKSQSPQVMVSLRRNVANTVVVSGAVADPRRVPLTLARERLLDVIAETGGISRAVQTGSSTATGTGAQDAIVRFTRGGRTVEQPLDTITAGSPDDLALLGGDRIELIRQPRTYTIFGAIDRISQVPFESRTLTLAEALARAGGPNDGRADPRAVFVFRQPPLVAISASAPPIPPLAPIVYRIDMMRAENMFLAQRFVMRDKDLLYIANARANQPLKLIQALGQLFAPVFSIQAATR